MSFDVKKIAELACLDVDEDTQHKLAKEMAEILDYVGTLNAIDTREIPATAHVVSFATPFRQDMPGQTLAREAALANAPQSDEEAFIVPRVV